MQNHSAKFGPNPKTDFFHFFGACDKSICFFRL